MATVDDFFYGWLEPVEVSCERSSIGKFPIERIVEKLHGGVDGVVGEDGLDDQTRESRVTCGSIETSLGKCGTLRSSDL